MSIEQEPFIWKIEIKDAIITFTENSYAVKYSLKELLERLQKNFDNNDYDVRDQKLYDALMRFNEILKNMELDHVDEDSVYFVFEKHFGATHHTYDVHIVFRHLEINYLDELEIVFSLLRLLELYLGGNGITLEYYNSSSEILVAVINSISPDYVPIFIENQMFLEREERRKNKVKTTREE